ncbi:MAG: UDP-N-acetylmuramate dehydrogenase [Phycisphaerales bacterium]
MTVPINNWEAHAAAEPAVVALDRIPTWFGVGGGAKRFCRPTSEGQLARCLGIDPELRVLGDGANLIVDDEGVDELVVALDAGEFTVTATEGERVIAGAGVRLPRLITRCVSEGLAGLEGLGGIPASVGGAVVMNAGGAFGQIADAVSEVHAVTRGGGSVVLRRQEIAFGYRTSGLQDLIITRVVFHLRREDPALLRRRLLEVMDYKKKSQPLGDNSAGCCFKNPTLERDVDGIGRAGERASAGMVIDRAGLKGLRVGSAVVSEVHGNFLVAEKGGCARDVITLMERVEAAVRERFGIELRREVVVWRKQ